MPDPVHISVCVVALTQSDYNDLDAGVQAKLTALAGLYDFTTTGKPYSTSPDEWRPFYTDPPIREYLAKAELQATFFSSQLYDDKVWAEVLKKTHLYIIDPFVLAHSKKRDFLAAKIQTAILVSDKAFCIILPEDLPEPLRTEIGQICATKLRDLQQADSDSYEWEVENGDRLHRYLRRMWRQLGPKPDPVALLAAQAILQGRGVPSPDLSGPPRLVR